MNCPIDNTELAITERQGVEIDYCPKCRGVWLDRGELDKIIDKSDASYGPARPEVRQPEPPRYPESEQRYGHQDGYHKKKKRESFLGDLFDF